MLLLLLLLRAEGIRAGRQQVIHHVCAGGTCWGEGRVYPQGIIITTITRLLGPSAGSRRQEKAVLVVGVEHGELDGDKGVLLLLLCVVVGLKEVVVKNPCCCCYRGWWS